MLSYAQYSDLELADLFNKKDEGVFSEIYDRYWAVLYRHARRLLQNDEEVKDLTQEVFLTLLDKSGELELTTTLSGYLYKISRNKILNRIDHDKVRDKYFSSLKRFSEAGVYESDFLVREQLKALIELEVAALPEQMRKIFELSCNQNHSHKEIAETLGASEGVVRFRT
ncbi:sigma-70 family RNA polymerase sigma factor [Pedobacter sp. AK013]|uniref:sigma-70 family RNA polymerase sigma factor n=1 Tax=Pedobacter sp. AK013 TaxID=2723071 RepID=UPI00161359C9|nr:sigma-70 family RNA polymerase sigma factor [Pedobacter sp. AK013]